MRSFRTHKAFVAYINPQKEKILKYIEFMYAVGSEMIKIDNLQERKVAAATKAGLKTEEMQTIFEEKDEQFKKLRHEYLSSFQFHNKFQNLMTFQQLLWNAHSEADRAPEGFDVGKLDKLVDFIDKLEGKTAKLFLEIYGDNQIMEIAKEQIKASISIEEKLKQSKK
jgi:hypothetical protein